MLGLMWEDVDFTAKKITLHRQIRYLSRRGHIIQQSKAVPALNVEKVSLLCTRNDGQIYQRTTFTNLLRNEGINAHSFRHTIACRQNFNADNLQAKFIHSQILSRLLMEECL